MQPDLVTEKPAFQILEGSSGEEVLLAWNHKTGWYVRIGVMTEQLK
jgi:hypothetical protein